MTPAFSITPHEPFANVAIQLDWSQCALYFAMAKLLRRQFGSKIHFYVRAQEEANGLRRDYGTDDFDSLTAANHVWRTIAEPVADEAGLINKAQAYERTTGVTINRLM